MGSTVINELMDRTNVGVVSTDPVQYELPFMHDANPPRALEIQVGGDHYKKLKIQPIEYILANEIRFVEGNVIKYVTRWKDKGGVGDLRKARHILDILIENEERGGV